MQHGHDVRVAGAPAHRPLLARELFEVKVVAIRAEYLHRDETVECWFVAPIHDAESAAPHRLSAVVALCLQLGDNSQRAVLSGIGTGCHGFFPGHALTRGGPADRFRPTQRVVAQPRVNVPIADAFVAGAYRTPANQTLVRWRRQFASLSQPVARPTELLMGFRTLAQVRAR